MQKVLVTGASGFTGSHLVKRLVEGGYLVRALVRRTSDLSATRDVSPEYVFADLADSVPLNHAVDGVDTVIHVAAAYRAENIPRRVFWDVNVGGTKNLLEAAMRARVKRFVHCSTVGVQGDIKTPPAKENDPYRPGDYYQESKRDAERLALEFFKREGLAGTVVRPTGIYGPGDTRFLKLFKSINSGRFRMIGSGDVLYHLVFVEDLVSGILLAAVKDEAVGEVFTLGADEYLTLNELVRRIAAILDKPLRRGRIPVWPVRLAGLLGEIVCRPFGIAPPIYRRRVDFFVKNRAFDISKAKRLLGYEPQVPLDEGLKRTAEWYKDKGWLS